MSSTYSPSLRIQLMGPGDQSGTWGSITTNNNFQYVIEPAIAGYQTVSVITANQALTYVDGGVSSPAANQSVYAMLRFTTTTGATFNVYAPPVSKQYIIWNNSGQSMNLIVSNSIGSTTPIAGNVALVIPNGIQTSVWSDGVSFYGLNTLTATTATLATTATTATNATNADNATNAVNATNATNATNAGTVTTLTSAQVGTAISGLAAGAVGTLAFLGCGAIGGVGFGSNVGGGSLFPAGLWKGSSSGTNNVPGGNNGNGWMNAGYSVSGTWKCMGYALNSTWNITVYMRVA